MTAATAVYVACADSGEIHLFHLDPAGAGLTAVQQVAVGGNVMPLALSPDRRHLYAARRSAPLEVLTYAIDPHDGRLALLGSAPLPHSMAYIATDRSGRHLLSASYGGDLIAVGPIGADGVAGPARQVLPTAPNAHAIQADPSNRYVLATSLGGGVVTQWQFDAEHGTLAPNAPPALRPHTGASPRHFVFGPEARHVYLLGELDAAIDVLAFDASTGTLRSVQTVATLPAGFGAQPPWAADLHLTPDGRFLYSSERRSSTLAAFSVDGVSGLLTPIGHVPTETQPRGFAVTPDGAFLVVAGQLSNHLSVYAIDRHSGQLAFCKRRAAGANPNWIECLTLDR